MLPNLPLLAVFLFTIFLPFVSTGTAPGAVPSQITLRPVAEGLTGITDVTHAGDTRLFITEQEGRIRVVKNGALLGTPFLDISGPVDCCGEKGLLGLAFHPSYSTNGYFFVNYTYRAGEQLRTRVSRFSVSAGNPDVADPNSERIILEFDQPFENHNGGGLQFGPDGYLYIASGDGGSGNDPQGNAQNKGNLLGKVLRIDVNATGGADCGLAPGRNYGIPASNPLANGAGGACDEIWSYGLRNPWRISFDRSTGDLWIADVGQAVREEVDFQPAGQGGQNYGWDCFEGTVPGAEPSAGCTSNRANYTFPLFEYDHSGDRCSITGGYVYRGPGLPALEGYYLFADFCSKEVWTLKRTAGGTLVNQVVTLTSGGPLGNLRTFGQDAAGEVYVASGTTVYKIVDVLSQ